MEFFLNCKSTVLIKNSSLMKLNTLLIGIVFVCGSHGLSAQETWDFKQCTEYAMENNIQIKQQGVNTEYRKNMVTQAKNNRLPNLNGSLANSLNYGRSLTYENTYRNVNSSQLNGYLSTDMTLWNGSVINNTIKQNEMDLQAELQDLQKTKDDIILNIAAAYLEILFAGELVTIAESQTELTHIQIDRTKKLVDAGSLAYGSLLEIEAQLAREELELINYKNQLQLAYLKLYQLLELPVEKNFKIKKPYLPEIKADMTMTNSINIYKNALKNRPEIKAAEFRVESAKRDLEIAKGKTLPKLTFGAYYFNLYNNKYTDIYDQPFSFMEQISNNQRYEMGFNLNIPIFNKFLAKNEISNASLRISEYKFHLQETSNILRQEIEQAYTSAVSAMNRYLAAEKVVKSTGEAFRYTEEKFNLDLINSLEYNQSKNYLTRAKSELLQAKYEYIFRAKILDFYNGIPIEL
jgi:outer membrane protein